MIYLLKFILGFGIIIAFLIIPSLPFYLADRLAGIKNANENGMFFKWATNWLFGIFVIVVLAFIYFVGEAVFLALTR